MDGSDNTTPQLAASYDDQISNIIPYYNCFHDEAINVVKAMAAEPQLWLDTGCGTGTLVGRCLNVFPNAAFFLVDPSSGMMSQAKKKLEAHASGRVKFLEPAATQRLILNQDFHFDVVTAIQCHHYLSVEERAAATRICYEALNRGGIFITFENVRPLTSRGIEIGKRNWGNYQLLAGKGRDQVERHLERFDSEYFPITVEEHLELYRRCGFAAVEILWFSCMQAGFYCIK
jgi:tRNA (cmo5U34)-methyltransferase